MIFFREYVRRKSLNGLTAVWEKKNVIVYGHIEKVI